jgi:hypothetical protein
MFCHWTMFDSVFICIASIQMSFKSRILLTLKSLLLTLTFTLKSTTTEDRKKNDKHDDFIFPIVNFSFISSNIPASPAYGVYISQLVRYSRACAQYSDFIDRVQLLTEKLLKRGCIAHRLKSSLQTSTIINTKYSHLKLHWIFYLLRRFYLSSITVKTFNELIYIYE